FSCLVVFVAVGETEVKPNWPLIYRGETITVRCEIQGGGRTEWTYEWKADKLDRRPTHNEYRITAATESDSGKYSCQGRNDYLLTEWSKVVTLTVAVSNMVTVTQQHDWPQIFSGETITVRCEIQGAGDTEWDYEWRTTRSITHRTHVNIWTFTASGSSSGDYMCKGRLRGDWYSSTKWSEATTVTVSHQPQPVLTVSPSWLSPGASVTLNCEVEHPSAGWRFYWYKAVPKLSAGYVCRAGRGDPVFYTQYSELKLVWSAGHCVYLTSSSCCLSDVDPAASLTVSPDRVQHFTSDSVSLSCEGNSAEWRVRRFPEDRSLSCPTWTSMTGSTCKISTSQSSAAVYWCESGSGEFSNSVNITLHDADIILVSPVRPVAEGDSVTLGCKLRKDKLVSSVFFYLNDKVIHNNSRGELSISAVSKSDEGFYKCQFSGQESPQSWMSLSSPRSVLHLVLNAATAFSNAQLLIRSRQEMFWSICVQLYRSALSPSAAALTLSHEPTCDLRKLLNLP
uniref:Ig-like domain-containing protein n=1 Tax=Mastacembelus armatus TaxID=205130 RepID=A0A3Q3MC20_9TELE